MWSPMMLTLYRIPTIKRVALFEGINDHGKAGCPRQLLGQPDFPVVINVG